MKQIDPSSLIDLAAEAKRRKITLRTDVVYTKSTNFLGEAIYREGARLWLHTDLAQIVLIAADQIYRQHGFVVVATDGLRTVDAQERMLSAKRTQENPQWIDQQMLSKPGFGGHPRGMAVDLVLQARDASPVDMGTKLDDMSDASARSYKNLPRDILTRRIMLETAMRQAAAQLQQPMFPLPSEWWDFRFPPEVYEQYAPLSDKDLPPRMRMCA